MIRLRCLSELEAMKFDVLFCSKIILSSKSKNSDTFSKIKSDNANETCRVRKR